MSRRIGIFYKTIRKALQERKQPVNSLIFPRKHWRRLNFGAQALQCNSSSESKGKSHDRQIGYISPVNSRAYLPSRTVLTSGLLRLTTLRHELSTPVPNFYSDRRMMLFKMIEQKSERFKLQNQRILKDIRDAKVIVRDKVEKIIDRDRIFTIPNFLCVSRLGISLPMGYYIFESNFTPALSIFVVAGITDLMDGWIARTFPSQSSLIGSFLDPLADKVLVATAFISLTYIELIPLSLTALIITRDVLLVAAAFGIRYQSLPPPRTFKRYFDVGLPTAQLSPTMISKINTSIQLVLVATSLAAPVFQFQDHPLIPVLWGVTAATTVLSAFSYIFTKGTYKFVKHK